MAGLKKCRLPPPGALAILVAPIRYARSRHAAVDPIQSAVPLALQNLVWGVAQPLAGWIADRHGSRRLIFGGCLLYGLGLAVTAHAATTLQLVLGAGLVIGIALACTAFGAIYGALGRMLAPDQRGWGRAAAGVGQFAAIPAAQGAVGAFGASNALLLLAAAIAMLCVCALALDDRRPPGQRASPEQPLAMIYLVRSLAIALFVLAPPGAAALYAFAVVMGVLWLGTVPLTNGIVSGVFGVRYLATMFGLVFLGHQAGSFCGVWLGGLVWDATGSYDLVWCATVAIGLVAAALHWPLSETPAVIPLRAA